MNPSQNAGFPFNPTQFQTFVTAPSNKNSQSNINSTSSPTEGVARQTPSLVLESNENQYVNAAVITKPHVVQANPDENSEELFVRNVFNENPELIPKGRSLGLLHQRPDGTIILSSFIRYQIIDQHKFDQRRFLRDLGVDINVAYINRLEAILKQFKSATKDIKEINQVNDVLVPIIKLYFETRLKNISDFTNNLDGFPSITKDSYFNIEKLVKDFPKQPKELEKNDWNLKYYSSYISDYMQKCEKVCEHLNPDSKISINLARKHFFIYMEGCQIPFLV